MGLLYCLGEVTQLLFCALSLTPFLSPNCHLFLNKKEYEKVLSYYRVAALLGWKGSMRELGNTSNNGHGCAKDLRLAVIWYARGAEDYGFLRVLNEARIAFEEGTTQDLNCDFDKLCYSLGWGLYWYMHGTADWERQRNNIMAFGDRCLDYYCEIVELR
jgi:TPR repeat protein